MTSGIDGVVAITQVRTEDEARAWDQYVAHHPSASGYHLTGWRRVVEEVSGHRTYYLMAKDRHGEVRGILPLAFMSSRLFGRFLVSMPFVNYGGVLTDGLDARGRLLEAATDLAKELTATYIELRHEKSLDLDWPCKQHKVSMRLELPGDFGTLWKEFHAKLRSQIRRAQKEHMTVRIDTNALLSDFYEVFARNMRDLGTPVYGRRFFEAIVETFPRETRICVVYLEQRPVAAALLYGFRNTLEIPWASSDRRFNRLAPNMLLYSSVLEYACREGFRVFDFGRSTPASGAHRFKEQWGARPVPLYWYYWLGDGRPLPHLSPENSKYSLAIKTWSKLPVALTRIIGPAIVRHIP
jgi:FemAB-related protein (PEP-CTERM system-associated)